MILNARFGEMRLKNQTAQVFLEYVLLIGIVTVVMIAMTPFVKRTVQAMVKLTADQIGNQKEADQEGGERGYLVNSYTISRMDQDIRKRERLGVSTVDYLGIETAADTRSVTNLGFSPRP